VEGWGKLRNGEVAPFIKTSSDCEDYTDFLLPLSGKHPFHPLNPMTKIP
jgi:hypothetical protein